MTDRFFNAERRPPLDHGAFVEHAAIVFEECAALRQHFVFDHLVIGQAKVASLLENDLDVTRGLGVDHFIGDTISEMLLQLGMAFEKRQVALVGDAVKVIDLGDKTIPVLPKHLDRLHRQAAIAHVGVEAPVHEPAVGNVHQIFF